MTNPNILKGNDKQENLKRRVAFLFWHIFTQIDEGQELLEVKL